MSDTGQTEDKEKILKTTQDRVRNYKRDDKIGGVEKCMTVLIQVFSWFLIMLFFPIAIPMCIRTVQVLCINMINLEIYRSFKNIIIEITHYLVININILRNTKGLLYSDLVESRVKEGVLLDQECFSSFLAWMKS